MPLAFYSMEGKIFLRALRPWLDPENKNAPRPEVKIKAATLSGDVFEAVATCTSSNFKNDTFNFRITSSGEIRTIHAALLLQVNGREVML